RFSSVQAFAQALSKASQEQDEAGKEDTVPLKALGSRSVRVPSPASSPTVPATPKVFLAASPADSAQADQLAKELGRRGISCASDLVGTSAVTLDAEQSTSKALRSASVILLLFSSQTLSSRTVREYLRVARVYQKRLLCFWVGGESIARFHKH